MFCNYENINDYCTNKYSYQYYDISSIGNAQFAVTGNNQSPVIRTDKDTLQQQILYPNDSTIIQSCSLEDDITEAITSWECYQLFLLSPNSIVKDADINSAKNTQLVYSQADFNSSLNDGMSITIDGYGTITLKSSIEDQIHYGNIAMLANILYTENNNNSMPDILDINNIAYSLEYNVLNTILTTYFNNFANKKYTKDSIINSLNNNSNNSIDDINLLYFCANKVPSSYLVGTTISEPLIHEPPKLPPHICDPICDTSQCLDCVDNQCVSKCSASEYCCDGVCRNCPCNDCPGQCRFTWTSDPGGYWTVDFGYGTCASSVDACCCPEPDVPREQRQVNIYYYTNCNCGSKVNGVCV